ncbi:MAG TPA: hypothetical protein VI997_11425 [Candidatus Thermoplasmatota archaeon]|nr:hypothetical protein [Candidatus Thermoplasmatota archaeon]
MDAPQVVLLVVGGLLLAGGTVGMFAVGGVSGGPATLYTIAFTPRSEDLPLDDGAWASPGGSVAFRVTRLNVTEVKVSVSCTDPNPLGGADVATVTVSVAGPAGLAGEDSGGCGSDIVVPVKTGTPPEPTTARGSSPDAAAAGLPPSFTLTNATGEWTIDIAEQRTQNLPLGGAPSGEVTVTVTSYQPAAQVQGAK